MDKQNIKKYKKRTWKNYDIPTSKDLDNIETGISENNEYIISLNNELNDYETGLDSIYKNYKQNTDTKLTTEVTKLEAIEKKCYEAFDKFKSYISKYDSLASSINNLSKNIITYTNLNNRVISDVIKNQYTTSHSFSKDVSLANKDPDIFFPRWVAAGSVNYYRQGNNFKLGLTIRGSITNELANANDEILLMKIPCVVTCRKSVKIDNFSISGVLQSEGIYLKPDGAIVLYKAVFSNSVNLSVNIPYSTVYGDWRYLIDDFNILVE